jgi:hypothetical protein
MRRIHSSGKHVQQDLAFEKQVESGVGGVGRREKQLSIAASAWVDHDAHRNSYLCDHSAC